MSVRVKELLSLATQDEIAQLLKASNKQLEPKAAAAYLNVSVRCLEDWRKRGIGPKWRKTGKRILYGFSDLDACLCQENQTQTEDDSEA